MFPVSRPRRGLLASLLTLLALAGYPMLVPLEGRSWWQAELFAFAPDPTTAFTFGALLFWRAPWPLWVIPLLWCAVSSASLAELKASHAWLLPAFALVAIVRALMDRRTAASR